MKKLIVGALVGGIIAFAWQTASHTFLDLHYAAERHSPKQDTVLAFLQSIGMEEGNYLLPRLPQGASAEEMEAFTGMLAGKPWATLSYRQAWDADMGSNILRGFLSTILMAGLLTWIVMQMASPAYMTVVLACVFVGLVGFVTFPYAAHVWYRVGSVRADLADAVMMWGLCGLWLGWWVRRTR